MSWKPISIPSRANRHRQVSVAVLRRYGREYVTFRFARRVLKAVGWGRAQRIRPHHDPERPGLLMLAPAGGLDPAARSLEFKGGHTLSASWARMDEFEALVPSGLARREIPVVEAAAGQLVLDLSALAKTGDSAN